MGHHARTAVARLPLRQLGFFVMFCLCTVITGKSGLV